jgi:RNA polymerase sigma factor (sigma-70 family)
MVNDDTDLVMRTIQGEENAFEGLVRKYQDAVYGLAFHLIGDFTEAQDIAQQTFVTAYFKLSRLKDPGKFVHWINKITINQCMSWLRRQQNLSHIHGQIEFSNNQVLTPDQEYEAKEINTAVMKAMESLSEKNRLAITLYCIDGLSQREVANFLGTSTSAVENRISRARKQLKEEMMKLVEDTFKDNKLPDNFIQKVEKALGKAQKAKDKGDFDKALVYSDEALDTLAGLPRSPEARRLQKEALWLKGDTFKSQLGWRGVKEYLKYHEEALKLEEEEGDKPRYAESLLRIATDYGMADQREKEIECKQKAVNLYEEAGDLFKKAETNLWLGASLILTEPEKANEIFQSSLDLFKQMKDQHLSYESLCRAAISVFNIVGNYKLLNCRAGSEVLEKTPEKLAYANDRPGFTYGTYRGNDMLQGAIQNMTSTEIIYSLQDDGMIFDYHVGVGEDQITSAWSYTFQSLQAKRTIESKSETITVAAGTFQNCLKLRAIITSSPDDDAPQRDREINRECCGTKIVWFAPGVGPVKLVYNHANGNVTEVELEEYSVVDESDSYFPLSIGNRWVYYYPSLDQRYVTKDCYEVAVQKGNVYYIDHYGYSYFPGDKEGYDALYIKPDE